MKGQAVIVNVILICGFSAAVVLAFKRAVMNEEVLRIGEPDFKTEIIFLTIIGIVAVAVRLWQFGSVPGGFNQDGAMAAVDALALAEHGTDRFGMPWPVHFQAWGYGQMSVLLSYLMIPFIKLGGLNPVTARLPVLIISCLGLVVLYLFSKKIFGVRTALIILGVGAVNPWHIMQSRWALDCNMLPHFLLFSMFFLYLGSKKKLYLYVSMIFFGLTMYTYGIAWYAVPLMLVCLCVYMIVKKRIKIWEAAVCFIVYMAVAWPIFAVILINYFKLETMTFLGFTMAYFPQSVRAGDLVIFSTDFLSQLAVNIQYFQNVVLLQKEGLPWNAIPEYGAMYLFAMPLVVGGLLYSFTRDEDDTAKYGSVLILIWLAVSVMTALMVNHININRINIIFYPLIILCGMGIHYMSTGKRRKIVLGVTAVIFAVAFSLFSIKYFGSHNDWVSWNFFDGFEDALYAAEETGSEPIYITYNTQYEGSVHVSEILTMFHSGDALLPLDDEYVLMDFRQTFNTDTSGVYVVKRGDLKYFNLDNFTMKEYREFVLLLPLESSDD